MAAPAGPARDAIAKDLVKLRFKVKGGQLLQYMQQDKKGRSLEKFVVLCKPMEKYLNHLFAAERVVTRYTEVLRCNTVDPMASAGDEAGDVATTALRNEAIKRNG